MTVQVCVEIVASDAYRTDVAVTSPPSGTWTSCGRGWSGGWGGRWVRSCGRIRVLVRDADRGGRAGGAAATGRRRDLPGLRPGPAGGRAGRGRAAGVPVAEPVPLRAGRRLPRRRSSRCPSSTGRSRRSPSPADPWITGLPDDTARRTVWQSFLGTPARIHQVDADAARSPGAASTAELEWWERYLGWATDGAPPAAPGRGAGVVLAAHRPARRAAAVAAVGRRPARQRRVRPERRPRAILDWDMASVGPAEMDLAWFLALEQISIDLTGRPSPGSVTRGAIAVDASATSAVRCWTSTGTRCSPSFAPVRVSTRIAPPVRAGRTGRPMFEPGEDPSLAAALERIETHVRSLTSRISGGGGPPAGHRPPDLGSGLLRGEVDDRSRCQQGWRASIAVEARRRTRVHLVDDVEVLQRVLVLGRRRDERSAHDRQPGGAAAVGDRVTSEGETGRRGHAPPTCRARRRRRRRSHRAAKRSARSAATAKITVFCSNDSASPRLDEATRDPGLEVVGGQEDGHARTERAATVTPRPAARR